MGSFVFKWPHPNAREVHVTGTFDDWGKTELLNKVGDTWEKEVQLPSADEKFLYKFVINDDDWVIDHTAPQEDDGHHNVNNVLYPNQIKRRTAGEGTTAAISSAAPGSTTAALAGNVPKESTFSPEEHQGYEESRGAVPGAFPETPANELDSYGVHPIPASSGIGNPVNLPAGEKVPPANEVTSNTVQSTATTSKEDYERDASAALPAAGGAALGIGAGLGAASAFSKHEDKKNIIPESSLPMGGKATDTFDSGPTVSSAAPSSTTAGLAGGVPLEKKRQGMIIEPEDAPVSSGQTTQTVPEMVKESIADAHQDPEAAASAEAVKEKSEVEKELLKKIPSTDAAGEPAPTIAAATSETAPSTDAGATTATKSSHTGELATGAAVGGAAAAGTAAAVKHHHDTETSAETATGKTPGTSSAAAAAVADGTDHSEVPTSGATKTAVPLEKTEGDRTEYAPPKTTTDTPGVSSSAAAAVSDGAEDSTLADEPAFRMMTQNESHDAPQPAATSVPTAGATSTETSTKDTPATTAATTNAPTTKTEPSTKSTTGTTAATASSATSTPVKKDTTSTTSSPAVNSAKDKKKKNRISGFFKKMFD